MKSKLFCSMLLTLTVSMSVAKDIMPEKRIYLLDLSGSMIGQGSVRTDNVLEKMKSDLEATVDWTSLPTDFVFIPFTDRLMPEFGGTDTKKRELMTEISSIETEAGNTDIASAWECALGKLDSTKVNYIFLLSDGYHNRGISKPGLNSLLKSWPQSTGRCDAEAYFVSLSPKYRTSEIARIFDETDRMSVVETMNICRQTLDVEQTEQQLDNSITVAPDDTNKSCSLLWLWILLIILLVGLMLFIFKRFIPAIIQAPHLGLPWYKIALKPNARLVENPDQIAKPTYNPEGKTIAELAKEYGFDIRKIRKRFTGEPDFRVASIGTFKVPKGTMDASRKCHRYVWQQFAKKHGVTINNEIWRYPDAKDRIGKLCGINNLNDYTVHERCDGRTCDIIPNWLNHEFAHDGGVAYQKNGWTSWWLSF